MATILVFLAFVGIIAAWWLRPHRLASKPWLEESSLGDVVATGASPLPTRKIGLFVFLAVAGSLFSLTISAYFMRMHMADWQMLPDPPILWFNTGLLIVSSIALERSRRAAAVGRAGPARSALVLAGCCAAAFLVGQVVACRQLAAAGFYAATNPASSFFYLLTTLHGLHLAGGLVALGRTGLGFKVGTSAEQFRSRVELCAIYWHFLLLVWFVLFGLLEAT